MNWNDRRRQLVRTIETRAALCRSEGFTYLGESPQDEAARCDEVARFLRSLPPPMAPAPRPEFTDAGRMAP